MNTILMTNERTSVVAGLASLTASIVAGIACIGPLLGITMGVTGLGWLSQFAYLTGPASITSILLLVVATTLYVKRRVSCANRNTHILNMIFLVVTGLIVIGINVFEFLIFPNLL